MKALPAAVSRQLPGLLLAGGALLAAALLAADAFHRQNAADARELAAHAALRAAGTAAAEARANAELARQAAAYETLWRAARLYGGEDYGRWSGWLDQQRAALDLPGLSYEFVTGDKPGQAPASGWRSSRQALRLQARHEGEVLRFLDALANPPGALLDLRRCRLTAPADGGLLAECEALWLSLPAEAPP